MPVVVGLRVFNQLRNGPHAVFGNSDTDSKLRLRLRKNLLNKIGDSLKFFVSCVLQLRLKLSLRKERIDLIQQVEVHVGRLHHRIVQSKTFRREVAVFP